jgi:hypothetical protein
MEDPFGVPPPPSTGSPMPPPGPAWAPTDESNTLATLSVIFAFVFAPAGAVLGHLASSKPSRTRQFEADAALVWVRL